MKKILIIAFLTFGMLSCRKEHLVPEPIPKITVEESTFDKYVLDNDSGYAEVDTIYLDVEAERLTLPILNGDLDTINIDMFSPMNDLFIFDHLVKGQFNNIKVKGNGHIDMNSNKLYLNYSHIYVPTNNTIHTYTSIYSKI